MTEVEPVEGEVLPPASTELEAVEEHRLSATKVRGGRGVVLACDCGEWEAFASSDRMLARVRAEHREHVARHR